MTPAAPRRRAPTAIIVGSGIAGLATALELGHCTVVTRGALGDGASRWAQGGIAAAIGPGDSPAAHAADTLAVSGGLAVREAVEAITAAAPERVRWLHQLGTELDVDATGQLLLGREAGHRARRIVHAGGDATGAAAMQALVAAVRSREDIEVVEHHRAVDLVRCRARAGDDTTDRVVGVLLLGPDGGTQLRTADAVVLATGGIGRIYARTTNPDGATGDGLAMAWRSGAAVRDPEFVQFHPTALDADLDPLPLLTEALRGEGAHLVDGDGDRFLVDVHPDAELAPRDVVARACWHAQQRGAVYLDARHLGAALPARFPTVFAAAMAAGIDPRSTPIPTTPAQHYHVGGVLTDGRGRTTVPGLYACGETASVGLHGANRLASNSLVEGLVMGARVAAAIDAAPPRIGLDHDLEVPAAPTLDGAGSREPDGDAGTAIDRVRTLMWHAGGLVRDAAGLGAALGELDALRPTLERDLTGRNVAVVAEVVLRAALARRESRGGHHRRDHPDPLPGPGTHTVVRRPDVPHAPLALRPVATRRTAP